MIYRIKLIPTEEGALLPFPPESLEEVSWKIGDELHWYKTPNGIGLEKVEKVASEDD